MNKLTLSDDINRIETEIQFYKEQAGQSIWEIGRRLNHVKEYDLVHGEFGEWLRKIGINQRIANQFMKVANEIPNSSTYSNLGSTALYLIATLPEEEKQIQLDLAEEGNPSTVKELRELKKSLKEKDNEIESLSETIYELNDRPPTVITKTVTKEVTPDDYDGLKSDVKQLSERNRQLEQQLKEMMAKRQEVDRKSDEYDKLNQAIQEMQGQMTKGQKQIAAQKEVYDLVRKGNELIEELAPLSYLIDTENVLANDYAQKPIKKIIDNLRKISDCLEDHITNVTLEGEIIDG
ncbi:DUF3102 domain-containing protein [Aerococcus sanguinicola]|uniref:DUF3102 domain-containing protein n=1 Tax=Aerococcus sanguinicola TaxID=119206 RepID=UPI0018A7B2F5|nr:DUF3102 domain-containing protein [Aerococcus sanguinicola]